MYVDTEAEHIRGQQVRLLLGSNHALLRELLELQFKQSADIGLIASAWLDYSLPGLVAKLKPDILLLTPGLGTSGGHEMELIRSMVSGNPRTRVILISSGYLPGQVALLSEYGVAGLLLESQDWQTLVRAIRSVHGGAFFATPSVLRSVTGVNQDRPQAITPAEADLLELVSEGLSNQEIGRRLNVAESTVRSRLSVVLLKLNATNRTHAVATALREGYLPISGARAQLNSPE